MQRWKIVALARGIQISLNRRRDMCIPCFFVLLLKEISSISSNTTSNTTRVKTGIKQHAKMENCGARRGDTHITEPAQGYAYPLFFCSLAEGNIVDII